MDALLLLLLTLQSCFALPTEPTRASPAELALITPAPTPTLAVYATYGKRGVVSDITAGLDSYVGSVLSDLGSAIPSYVSDGLFPGFQNLPTGSQVLSSAGVSSSDLAASPTQVLNIPGYANWTNNTWNMRFHGNVFKQPNISNATIDKLANGFLIDTSVSQLPQSQADQARNLTREIYVVQQGNVNVTMMVEPGSPNGGDGEATGGGGVIAAGSQQTINLPYPTTEEGDFDVFVPLQDSGYNAGDGDFPAQKVNVYAEGTDTGNATSYLVSTHGLTVVNDIDDILRVTQIYEPKEGLLNSFARPFTPWMNMPDIYRNWSTSLPNMHFHYLTTTPEQITRNYMEFIYSTYPGGSFDTRPLNFSDLSATLSIRKYLLDKIFQTYPHRKFILVADTSNSDVMRDYPEMATQYPGQVQCIFLRNTSSTDPGDKFPYNTKGFENLNTNMYMFFKVPDDLTNLDIVNGQCLNTSIQQNVTFGYQGLPFGLSSSSNGSSNSSSGSSNGAARLGVGRSGWMGTWSTSGLLSLAMVAFFAL